MRAWVWVAVAGAAMWTAGTARAEVNREQIEDAIEKGVKFLISRQVDDGHWPYFAPEGQPEWLDSKVGHTALAVLALQHSGSRNPESSLAMKKGVSYILQQYPERRTYSSGLVEQVLFGDNPKDDAQLIAAYAWMLIGGQKPDGVQMGSWEYYVPNVPATWKANGLGQFAIMSKAQRSDNSNSQFGILGLVYAEKAGFQVPRIVWERARDYYIGAQHKDGGWDYQSDAFRASTGGAPGKSALGMTFAATVSEYLCEEALADKSHKQCKTPPVNKTHEAGLKWIGENWPNRPGITGAYDWYAAERLGILIGYSEFGGHDWYQDGLKDVMTTVDGSGGGWGRVVNSSLSVLFLARGRYPIIINKLKREGDWNLHRFDVNHLIEHISGPWQIPCQWRIVTLDAKTEFLLKVPILWISGHEALKFTPEEKAKLKEYVEKGGTILGEDCCSKKPFDESFREILKELWPDNTLTDLPKTHAIYTSFRKLENKPNLMGMALEKGQGRLGVIYIPNGISCRWEVGGAGSRPWLDTGACIYLYVEKIGKRMRAEPTAPEPAATPATPAAPAPEAPAADAPKTDKPADNAGQ